MKLPMKSLMLVFSVALFLAPRGMADVRYSGWEHSGPLWIQHHAGGCKPAGRGGGGGVVVGVREFSESAFGGSLTWGFR